MGGVLWNSGGDVGVGPGRVYLVQGVNLCLEVRLV